MTEASRESTRQVDDTQPTRRHEMLRGFVVDMNEGIVATAGVIEGLLGAGADTETIVVAALAAAIAGAISLAGARYSEAAMELDAEMLLIEEHRRQLARSPAEELAELTAHYEEVGLTPEDHPTDLPISVLVGRLADHISGVADGGTANGANGGVAIGGGLERPA